jgi:hypothetical protein
MLHKLILGVLIVTAFVSGCQKTQSQTELKPTIQQDYGIQVESLQLSAAGYMIDFRYRVVDPSKAYGLLQRDAKTYLIDKKTNSRLIVPTPPKVGALRQKTQKPESGKIYFALFANPGRLVKKGDKVTVVINDFKTDNMTVQ